MVITVGTDPDRDRARRKRQGAKIRDLRERHSFGMVDFAELLGVSVGAVSQWETGRYTPRLRHQLAIARALNVPPSLIFEIDTEAAVAS